MNRLVVTLAAVLMNLVAFADECPPAANREVEMGWTAYRSGEMDVAGGRFDAALRLCPDHRGAMVGHGYVALRGNDLVEARSRFSSVVAREPDNIDALIGLGLIAWREGRHEATRAVFSRVLELDPENETAHDYIARLPAILGAPPGRPPLVRPAETRYPARAISGHFEIRTERGWRPFYINGVNLGAALPGKHPSEFPSADVYARWSEQMAAMGANTVRVYTIHPPAFYDALAEWNRNHASNPLWVVHGVWTELPPDHDFSDPKWEGEFFDEMHRVIDLLHGRADIAPRPGHAWGHYTSDVSEWVLAWVIGREWEPYAVVEYNSMKSGETSFHGVYLDINEGTPMDVWLARACEEMVSFEMDRYNAQRPIAYTNWPTLDPLHHETESTVAEEVAMRRKLGEQVEVEPLEYDNDIASLDATLVSPTSKLPAGYFASYHAYPYYPDFMILDPAYGKAESREGPSNYLGYLRDLARHHGEMPVVISEYGVPASIGIAHLQPQGWHHGGHTEERMAEIDARMTREIAEAGLAGGIIFAWIDEWFKKNWITIEMEIPLERNRLWFNRLDAEQHYGMLASDAKPPVAGETLAERIAAWKAIDPIYGSKERASVRIASDEAYLWLLYDSAGSPLPDEVLFGFDVVLPEAGERSWPGQPDGIVPVGIEFALVSRKDVTELMVQREYNPFRLVPPRVTFPHDAVPPRLDRDLPPGVFTGRLEQRFGRPFRPVESGSKWESLNVVPNRRRFGRDGTEFASVGYDRGILREGNAPDGLWERDESLGVVELRIPWAMLNFTDPSERRVLLDPPGADRNREFGTTTIDSIGVVVATRSGSSLQCFPSSGRSADVARYAWPRWEVPEWRERVRPAYYSMRKAYGDAERIAGGQTREMNDR